jgi:hypothetical protein
VRTHPVDKLSEQHCYKSAAVCYNLYAFMCVVLENFAMTVFFPASCGKYGFFSNVAITLLLRGGGGTVLKTVFVRSVCGNLQLHI